MLECENDAYPLSGSLVFLLVVVSLPLSTSGSLVFLLFGMFSCKGALPWDRDATGMQRGRGGPTGTHGGAQDATVDATRMRHGCDGAAWDATRMRTGMRPGCDRDATGMRWGCDEDATGMRWGRLACKIVKP